MSGAALTPLRKKGVDAGAGAAKAKAKARPPTNVRLNPKPSATTVWVMRNSGWVSVQISFPVAKPALLSLGAN